MIVYHDPAQFDQIDGVTWDGRLSGKITGGSVAIGNWTNSLFAQGTQIVDRHGKVMATGTYGAKFWQATWADDEIHFCLMSPFDNPGNGGIPTTLLLEAPGQPSRSVARVGTLYNSTNVDVLVCSVTGDRAVVVQSAGQGIGVAQYWVIQLSTGRILWTHEFASAPSPAQLVSSREGQYVAEDRASGGAVIYGPDGQPAATLQQTVDFFSWDGARAVTSTDAGAVQILAWRHGQVTWTSGASSGTYFQGMPEPGGTGVAVELRNSTYGPVPDSTGLTPIDLIVVTADGSVVFQLNHVHVFG